MEFISCCVPRCNSKCPKDPTNSAAVGEQVIHMFSVPHTDRLFKKWKSALEDIGKEITKDDHVCELHFLENEIERFYITQTSDGSVIEIEKIRPTLKFGVLPSVFSISAICKETESPRKSPSTVVINSKKRKIDESSTHSISKDKDDSLSVVFDSSADISVEMVQQKMSPKKERISYKDIIKNLQLIKRPSVSWSVVSTDKFIIFARWNDKFVAEKRIVIENNLTVRVFLKDWEMIITDLMDINCVDDITALLEKVESYSIDLAGSFPCSTEN